MRDVLAEFTACQAALEAIRATMISYGLMGWSCSTSRSYRELEVWELAKK